MAHGITGIDHLLIGVATLDQAAQAWRRAGFTISPRGRHIGWGTGNYCVMFPDDYIELLGIIDAKQFTNGLDTFLESGEGGLGLSWGTRDAEASATSLTASGLPCEVKDLARQLELEEDTVLPRFKLGFYDTATATPGINSFLCQHLTPAMIRHPGWLMHANAAIGLKGVTVRHPEPLALVETYEKLLGPASVNTTDGIVTLHIGRQRVMLADAGDLEVLHPDIDFFEIGDEAIPRIILATLASHDLSRTADHMAEAQIEHEEQRDGTIITVPEALNGVALEFVKR